MERITPQQKTFPLKTNMNPQTAFVFHESGLAFLPEFGQYDKFFCFKTSNSQKRLAFLKKVCYTVNVIGYLCPNAWNKSAVWQKRIRREGSCAEKILVRVIRHFAWERWRSKPSTGNAVIRHVPFLRSKSACFIRNMGGTAIIRPVFRGVFFRLLRRFRKTKESI